jgi:hypothetical protein
MTARDRRCQESGGASEDLACEVRLGVDAAYECDHLAACDGLDRALEFDFGGVLEEHPHLAQALVFVHRRERPLDRRERVLQEADNRIPPGPMAMHVLGAAPNCSL